MRRFSQCVKRTGYWFMGVMCWISSSSFKLKHFQLTLTHLSIDSVCILAASKFALLRDDIPQDFCFHLSRMEMNGIVFEVHKVLTATFLSRNSVAVALDNPQTHRPTDVVKFTLEPLSSGENGLYENTWHKLNSIHLHCIGVEAEISQTDNSKPRQMKTTHLRG